MRMIRATEAIGPLVESLAAIGIGWALLYVYIANLSAGLFFGLISGIFLLYDPIKTLSKIHIVMQRSISATTEVFRILDSLPTVGDAPDAIELPPSKGRIEFEQVSFRYAPGSPDAVKNVSLRIEPGKATPSSAPAGRQVHHFVPHPAPLRSHFRRGES